MQLIGIHATDKEMEQVKRLKGIFNRKSNSDLLRFLIAEGEKILQANVSIETISTPSPSSPSVTASESGK